MRAACLFPLFLASTSAWVTLTRPGLPSHARPAAVYCSAFKDPHTIVGVPRGATLAEIRRAYRKRARELHPDLNKAPDATERFRDLVQAFKQLVDSVQAANASSKAKRSASERARRAWEGGGSSREGGRSSPPDPAGSRRENEEKNEQEKVASDRRRRRWREMLFEEIYREHMPLRGGLDASSRLAFVAALESAVQDFAGYRDAAAGTSSSLSDLTEAERALEKISNREVLTDEIADVRHRESLHRSRARHLDQELLRAERRAEQWRGAVPSTQTDRIQAMERELAFLELASRLRERAAEQRLALERLGRLRAALVERMEGLSQRT